MTELMRRVIEALRDLPEERQDTVAASILEGLRRDRRSELLAERDEAGESLARGEGREITPDSVRELAAAVKQRGRARLTGGGAAPR